MPSVLQLYEKLTVVALARCWFLGTLLLTAPTVARPLPVVEATWEELPRLVEGRQIETVLPDGTLVKGTVLEVAPEGLDVRVTKSSGPGLPRGERRLPREQLSRIRVKLFKGQARALLAIVGIVGPWAIAAVKYRAGLPEGAGGAGLVLHTFGFPVAFGILGYYAGKRLDDKSFDVKIVERRDTCEPPTPGSEPSAGTVEDPREDMGRPSDAEEFLESQN